VPAVAQADVARQVAPAVAAPAAVVEKAAPAEPGALGQQGMLPHGTAPIQPAPSDIGAATEAAGHGARQDSAAPAPAQRGTVADIKPPASGTPASGSVAAAAWPGRQAVTEEGAGAATPDAGPLGSASAPTGARPAAKMDERPKPLAPSVQPQAAGGRAGGVVAEATQAGAQPHPHVAAVSRALATATADAAAQAEPPEAPPRSAVTGAVQQTPSRPAAAAPAALPVPVRTGPAGSAAPAATQVAGGDAAPAKPVLAGAVPAVSGGPAAAPPVGAAADGAAPAPAPAVASPAPVGAIAPGTMALAPVQVAAGAAAPAVSPAVAPAEQAAPVAPAAQLGHAVAAVQIGVGGSGHVTIRLQPAELGHVQISISRDTAGAASVSVAVERPETLSRLQADLGHLHQALDRAGLPEQRSVSLHLAAGQDGQPPAGAGGGGGQGAPQGSAGGFQQGSGQGRQAAAQAALQPGSAAPGGEAPVLADAGGSWVRAGVNVTA